MSYRSLVGSVLLVGTLILTSQASASNERGLISQDLDCNDFATIQEARDAYYIDPSDPYDLDGDDNGLPCEFISSGGFIYDNGENSGLGVDPSESAAQSGGYLTFFVFDEAGNGIAGACFLLEDPAGIASTVTICDDDGTRDGIAGGGIVGLSTAPIEATVTIIEIPGGYELASGISATQYVGTVRPADLYFTLTPVQAAEPTVEPTRDPTPRQSQRPRETATSTSDDDNELGKNIADDVVPARVVRILTGDVIEVDVDGERETVRLLGITSPTAGEDGDCFGDESLDEIRSLLQDETVYLEADETNSTKDDELLRYVWLNEGDGLLVNQTLLEGGFATISISVPDLRHAEQMTEAQIEAIEDEAGLWAECT